MVSSGEETGKCETSRISKVRVTPKLALAGRALQVIAFPPCETVRKLTVVLSGPNFGRVHEMNEIEANVVQTFFYDSVPGGRYDIVAEWELEDGSRRYARDSACFSSFEVRCGEDH